MARDRSVGSSLHKPTLTPTQEPRMARGAHGMTRPNAKMVLAATAAGLAAEVLAANGGPLSDPSPVAQVRPPDQADGTPAKMPDEDPSRPVRSLAGHTDRVT